MSIFGAFHSHRQATWFTVNALTWYINHGLMKKSQYCSLIYTKINRHHRNPMLMNTKLQLVRLIFGYAYIRKRADWIEFLVLIVFLYLEWMWCQITELPQPHPTDNRVTKPGPNEFPFILLKLNVITLHQILSSETLTTCWAARFHPLNFKWIFRWNLFPQKSESGETG